MGNKYETRVIAGKTVMDSGAKTIGKVKDIVININEWNVEYFLVKIPRQISKELGVGGMMGATAKIIPQYIDKIGDIVKLSVDSKELVEKIEFE